MIEIALIIATFIVSLVGLIVALWRLEYAKKQYEITVKILKESRTYWHKRLKEDRKRGRRT